MKPISDARTCGDGCTYLRGRLLIVCAGRRKRLQPFPQTFANALANVCDRGRKRLREKSIIPNRS